jgi:hypothetical protein
VFRSGREPLEVEVFRVVNVAEHPDLRAPTLNGALHRLEDGEMVGVPFVYHDPDAFQFILVIPEGAEGRELSERAKLLEALMREPGDDIPAYVRHFRVVYGHEGLAEQVDDHGGMEVEVRELEPVDQTFARADYFPRLAGVLPRSTFVDHMATDLAALVADDELWLFARLDEHSMHSFSESSASLRLQLKRLHQVQVCVLTLYDEVTRDSRSAFLNPDRDIDAPVLELLARDGCATLILSDSEGSLVRSFRIEAPLETNARLILDRSERAPTPAPERWSAAVEEAREALPSDCEPHPFVTTGEPAPVAHALARLRLLERWSTPDRLDRALLQLGVPAPEIELARREIIGDAVRYGLSMTDALLADAVGFGFARDPKSLVETMEACFEQTATVPDHKLSADEVEANRAALQRQRERYGTSTAHDQSCTMEPSG